MESFEATLHGLSKDQIAQILYGSTYAGVSSNEQKLIDAGADILPLLTFTNISSSASADASSGSLSGSTDPLYEIYEQLNGLDSNITVDNLYAFYNEFKSALPQAALDALDSGTPVSGSAILEDALTTAATNDTTFQGLLGEYGLSVSDISGIYQRLSALSGFKAAEDALVNAVGNTMFDPITSISTGGTLQLQLSSSAPGLLSGLTIPASHVTWTFNETPVSVDSSGTVTTQLTTGQTGILTATVHGLVVYSAHVTVS